MEKKFKFVRVHRKGTAEYGVWYFKPQSIDDVELHWRTICGAEIREHCRERVEKSVIVEDKNGGEPYIHAPHPTTQFGMGVEAYMQVCNGIYALGMLEVENIAYQSRMDSFRKGEDIYLANGMTVFLILRLRKLLKAKHLHIRQRKTGLWTMFGICSGICSETRGRIGTPKSATEILLMSSAI